MAEDYTNTLNLPKTAFSMRANLPQNEPKIQEKWEKEGTYVKMRERNRGKKPFILHDGPPFSNGNIHMGTALNKVVKDFIVKSKSMTGHYAPYIPGWDNHGMPIESAIIKKNKLDRRNMTIPQFRSACHEFAQNFVDIQMSQFKRLGVLGDFEHPYTTMAPSFEAREVRVFGDMYKKGLIYKGLKPVYWCPFDETALAEAEIEYKDDKCKSVFVKFRVSDDKGMFTGYTGGLDNVYFVIWTTTVWTLPANQAICLGPDIEYGLFKSGDEYYVLAVDLKDSVPGEKECVAIFKGGELEGMKAAHPFFDRESYVINGLHVTLDAGTGCVHTAPGHGVDDYNIWMKYNFEDEILVPVDDRGRMNSLAGKYEGMTTDECSEVLFEDMKNSGCLLSYQEIEHQYPHCWRCKKPIVFRATPQWFCSVDKMKDKAAQAVDEVEWIPAWGKVRMTQMVRERADWCISRQRHWGLPIPVFYCKKCGRPICDDDTIEKIAGVFGEKGSNAWYEESVSDLMPEGYKCPDCGGDEFEIETDTLDGWFDSGSSHFAVIESGSDPDAKEPVDLYFEGADQFRGWFQSSLLTSVAAGTGKAPYKTVLTHGWVVDGEGKAMHKSLGNSIAPETVINKYGADLLRLWVASSDYRVDVRVSDEMFRQLSDAYRKIRNTARIMMANLGENDFDPDRDKVAFEDMNEIDKWAVSRMNDLVKDVRDAYDTYEFHRIYHAVNNFCTTDMSKLYIDIIKDRLYVEKKDSAERRSAQSALYRILSSLTRLIAPILSFTADEIWQYMPHASGENRESVFLNDIEEYDESIVFDATDWNKLFDLRDTVLKALEDARAEKLIGKALEAKVSVTASGDEYATLNKFRDRLAEIFIVSDAELTEGTGEMKVEVSLAKGVKCDRCWMVTEDGIDTEGGHLCSRCARTVGR